MKDIINWGILGPGRIAHKFAHDLQLAEGARLHAVASRSEERARQFASQYGAAHAYGSYEAMVACPELDIVYIASPHSGHHAHSLLFLQNKIPVLCEKPLAIHSGQVQEMVQVARANDTFFMEAIWTRFIPMFEKVLELVEGGTIGAVQTIRADFGFKAPFDPTSRVFDLSLGGGSLLDVGLYPVYLCTQLWGRPAEIKASATFGPTGSDDSCAMLFSYPDNRLGILDCSLVHHTRTQACLYGEKGTIRLHSRFHEPEKVTITLYNGEELHFHLPRTGHGYYHEIVAVGDCLRKGKTECEKLPLDFSVLLMENLDRVRQGAGIVYPGMD